MCVNGIYSWKERVIPCWRYANAHCIGSANEHFLKLDPFHRLWHTVLNAHTKSLDSERNTCKLFFDAYWLPLALLVCRLYSCGDCCTTQPLGGVERQIIGKRFDIIPSFHSAMLALPASSRAYATFAFHELIAFLFIVNIGPITAVQL